MADSYPLPQDAHILENLLDSAPWMEQTHICILMLFILFGFNLSVRKHKITSDKPAGRLKARLGLSADDHDDVKCNKPNCQPIRDY
ncbi:hypothetical protein DPMN_024020 [Dreissena polymorpha]|uniref:Uncharacterized protein n=1 Tax=Dreissena polymorpha TaxID=45954 RepID=A0A9D4RBX1_DREPO|nr:hypothetical protein DPMN_024020 [Dreissena polymorpha]